jgi:hypothetical protein
MKKRASKNDDRSRKHRQHRSDQTDREQHHREQPPEKFHGRKVRRDS